MHVPKLTPKYDRNPLKTHASKSDFCFHTGVLDDVESHGRLSHNWIQHPIVRCVYINSENDIWSPVEWNMIPSDGIMLPEGNYKFFHMVPVVNDNNEKGHYTLIGKDSTRTADTIVDNDTIRNIDVRGVQFIFHKPKRSSKNQELTKHDWLSLHLLHNV